MKATLAYETKHTELITVKPINDHPFNDPPNTELITVKPITDHPKPITD